MNSLEHFDFISGIESVKLNEHIQEYLKNEGGIEYRAFEEEPFIDEDDEEDEGLKYTVAFAREKGWLAKN